MMVVKGQRLLTVCSIFRVVDVEHQRLRRDGVTGDELIDQRLAETINILAAHRVFKTGDGRAGCERTVHLISIEGLVCYAESKHRVMPQGVAVVAVFVTGSDLIDALLEDVVQGVGDVAGMPRVVDGCAQAFGQTDLAVNAPE